MAKQTNRRKRTVFTKCDLINNSIKTILLRSIGLFLFFLRIHGIVPMSFLFFSHNFVVLQFSKKIFCRDTSQKKIFYMFFLMWMFICILAFYYVGYGNEIDFKIRSTIDGCRHFDSISQKKSFVNVSR
jgi:hypothetical protein